MVSLVCDRGFPPRRHRGVAASRQEHGEGDGAVLDDGLVALLPRDGDSSQSKVHPVNLELIGILAAIIVVSRIVAVSFVTRVFANFKDEQAVFSSSFAMFSSRGVLALMARHTGGFKLDIDLVSMSATVIFLSSLMMAFSLSSAQRKALC